jgi:hypothetical protein
MLPLGFTFVLHHDFGGLGFEGRSLSTGIKKSYKQIMFLLSRYIIHVIRKWSVKVKEMDPKDRIRQVFATLASMRGGATN